MKKKPLIMARAGGAAHGRENSSQAIRASLQYSPDIIELDLRKSRDGVVYCFHSSIPFGVMAAFFFKFFLFQTIQKLVRPEKFTDLIKIIPAEKIVYCDIKQGSINAKDLKTAFDRHLFKEVWIAGYTFNYLKRIKQELDSNFKYIYNFGLPEFQRGVKKATEIGLDYVQVFAWQCTKQNLHQIQEAGLDYTLCSFGLFFRRFYEPLAFKKNSVFVYYNDLSKFRRKTKS